MPPNFLEIFLVSPKEGATFDSPEAKQDLQWILDQCISGPGGLSFSFRQSATHPDHLLFLSCWASKADHDELDLQGITPKLLRKLISRITMPPIVVYFLLMEDEKRKEVAFDGESLGVKAWHVREGCRGEFEREAEKPRVMPSDEVERRIIEEGEKRAIARSKVPIADVWVSFETDVDREEVGSFGKAVESFVEKVEGENYGKFLSG
ncbi:hypothetical protein V8E51_015472 [Hyaloscypha variabilis]